MRKSFCCGLCSKTYLLQTGTKEKQIITIELDLAKDIRFRNPLALASYVREAVENKSDNFYLFIDEIQMSDKVVNPHVPEGNRITFYDALNDLLSLPNLTIIRAAILKCCLRIFLLSFVAEPMKSEFIR
jgi:predicted AAA+ superfamily ATPase